MIFAPGAFQCVIIFETAMCGHAFEMIMFIVILVVDPKTSEREVISEL